MSNLKLSIVTCKRCPKKIATTNSVKYGNNFLWKKYAGICKDCITQKELNEILHVKPSFK